MHHHHHVRQSSTRKSDNATKTTNVPAHRILVVTCDLPSHPYAAAKLAQVLAGAGHDVTLAAPQGPAYDRIVAETTQTNVRCISAGTGTTTEAFNVRPVMDPMSWSTLFQALRNPFPLAQGVVEKLTDCQETMYEPLKREIAIGGYALVIPIHSASITVCDAVESVGNKTHVAIFSSLPYDPAIYLGERQGWWMPRSLTAFPHVATYSANQTGNILQQCMQVFWQLLDAWLTSRAWAASSRYNDARRARRGLPGIKDGWRGYLQKYPVLTFGGVAPFLDASSRVAANVTVVGSFESQQKTTPIHIELGQWWSKHTSTGIVYASFGTGTVLSDQEAAAVTGGLVHYSSNDKGAMSSLPPVLLAMRASEQQRLRPIFDRSVGSAPTSESDTHLEYLHGRLRIEADVPQATLLQSGQVRVFVSHMGMGGFVEGTHGGVPFVAYPSGCDQWFNAQRAVDAGIAVKAPYGLAGIGGIVMGVLQNDNLVARAHNASMLLEEVHGEKRALELVENVIANCSHYTYMLNVVKH